MNTKNFLSPPVVDRKHFEKNFLDRVIIELRFPTLLELEENNPIKLQKELRPKFPNYNKALSAQFTPAGSSNDIAYEFWDKYKKTAIRLTTSSISLTSTDYHSYEKTIEQCNYMIEKSSSFLETDFFTRVGMRYINKLSLDNSINSMTDWLNEDIVKAVSSGKMGTLSGLKMEFGGRINEDAEYLFRCGILDREVGHDTNMPVFVLDYDYHQTNVEVADTINVLDSFHNSHFNFFWWSLGDTAKKELENA